MLLNYGPGEDFWKSLGQLEIKWVDPRGNQHWILIGSPDVEAETPIV